MPTAEGRERPEPSLVSLLIPIRNEEAHIDACLRAVRAQTYPRDLIEVLVIDGDSSDTTVAIVAQHVAEDGRVRLLRNPDRLMPHGLNIGIRTAAGRYIGVVSGHSVLPQDYVSRAVDALERSGAWGVGGRIIRVASTPMHRAIAAATASRIGVGDSVHNYSDRPGWVETAFPGFWRRDVFEKVGEFDPDMLVNEDNELSLRIRLAGGRIWYEPAIEVEYVPRASLTGLFHQYRRYAIGKMRVLRKHRGGLRWRHLVPAAWILFLVGGGVLAVFVPLVRWTWVLGVAAYAGLVFAGSVRLARGPVSWWRIAAAFVTLHTGYGVGTWQGVAQSLAK